MPAISKFLGIIILIEWHELHKEELLEDWELCTKREMPNQIAPLE